MQRPVAARPKGDIGCSRVACSATLATSDHVKGTASSLWRILRWCSRNLYGHGSARKYGYKRQNSHLLSALISFGEYPPLLIS